MTGFSEKLKASTQSSNSLLCVGLDPVPSKLPGAIASEPDAVLRFNREIIDHTLDLVCAYKPNFGFYGALGTRGWEALAATIAHIPNGIPVIVDAKVGDIGSTAERYAVMLFEELGADATTVNPYMGHDAVEPFLSYRDKGSFLLCLTSNPSANDIEKRTLVSGRTVYEELAALAVEWDRDGNCGLVVGATQSEAILSIRNLAPELPLLVPGVGTQGGDVETTVTAATRPDGCGVLINASRSVIYASSGDNFGSAARSAAMALRDDINQYRPKPATA